MFKRLVFIFTLFFMSLTTVFAAVDAKNPYQQMQVAADELFKTLKQQQTKIKSDPEALRDIVRKDLLPYIQVKYAGALVLGSYYKQATEVQRAQFFTAFENYLVQTFSQALSMYNDQAYQVESEKPFDKANVLSIRVLLISPDKNQQPIRLDFQWRKNSVSGEWKAYDMIAEGISMISTKQNEWATTLRQGGVPALTQQLQQLANQPIKPE